MFLLTYFNFQTKRTRPDAEKVTTAYEHTHPPVQKSPSPAPLVPDAVTERNDRIEASIRKREAEVRAHKEIIDKDNEKERGFHLHEKATQHFKALLADMVFFSSFIPPWYHFKYSFGNF